MSALPRPALSLLVPALGLALAGCAKLGSLGNLDQYKPTVTFDKVNLTGADWNGADANFVFTVKNPNPVNVKVASFSYDLDLDGKSFLAGTNADGMALEAKGDSKLKLPVSIVFADVLALASDLSDSDTVPFTIAGDFGFDTPLGVVKIPYSEQGELPVLRMPKVSLKTARVGGIDLLSQKATLEIDLGVSNQGNANLSFADLDYDVKLGGTKVASGVVDAIGAVAGGQTQTVTLPLEVKLLDLGSSIVSAITNKEKVQVGVTASVDVTTPLGAVPLSISESGQIQLK